MAKNITGEDVMAMVAQQFPCCALLVAKTKSGKSFLIRYLLSYFTIQQPLFNFGMVMVGSKYITGEYTDLLPDNSVRAFDYDALKKYVKNLEQLHERVGESKMPKSFLVLDDCLGRIPANDNWWSNFVCTSRHLGVSLFLPTQYLKANGALSSTLVRENIGMLFVFRTSSKNTTKTIYDNWGQEVFETEEEFNDRLRRVTGEKYRAVLYINDIAYLNPDQNFLPFKAQALPENTKIKFQ